MTLALSSGVTLAWWIALAAGLVVALVVTALLELLRRTVHQINRGVDDILTMGGRLAQNTWTIQLFQATNLHAGELYEELRRHTRAERSDE
jgi:di/tricarboxylate transporter